jgi:sodium-dependent dicarboxylate transporter 2/3/5
MWLSNTATTMMLFPIALSVIAVMKNHEQPGTNMFNFSLVLMLVIAYASNIGGMATIIGTPPNVAFVSYIEKKYNYTVQFIDWMIVCVPLVIVLLGALYVVIVKWLFPSRIKNSPEANSFIHNEIHSLGKLSVAEKRVLVIFCATALLWITKDLLNQLYLFRLDDNMIAILGALALFATPSGNRNGEKSKMVLEWQDTSKMAWGILLLFGGGLAMASSLEKAGVMSLIGNWLAGFSGNSAFVLVLMTVVISIFLSELTSNVAQVIVMAPVLAALADALHLDPLMLGIPMTLAASAASMMPMGTPPNAIVFSSGYIRLKDMMKAGFVMNLVSIIIITLFSWYVLPLVMQVVAK